MILFVISRCRDDGQTIARHTLYQQILGRKTYIIIRKIKRLKVNFEIAGVGTDKIPTILETILQYAELKILCSHS